ncbi:paraquat-inducible integral membrane protein, putative [Bodo saltans]|uniref:Paraquat-inducible integral membrane protein, putative n=1 Tax=Bodo saltans TaxID=75058 RepID=A0A0S4JK99_BODSA|nr:paraquat-inducible integral membrane protein, putative [Bodo saltans]|eukprot:CUG90672.1 paraquat-inducible integral membrane protein, putative [Bodo saltans]
MNPILAAVVSLLGPQQSSNGYHYNTIALNEAETNSQPPFALAVGLASLFSGCAIAVIGYSAYRHSKRPVVDRSGEPIPIHRVLMEDAFVVVTCFFTMFLFAWSNSTKAAAVIIGDSYTMYTFSLSSTIQDLYSAGLYALCVFITLFCGFYPYFKLLSIVVYSVILQRPQSKVLMFIDSCGKLSLLDTFMMIIMVTGLEVPGIATVTMLPSFYVFLVATFLSILVGNYATHGWRTDSRGVSGTPLRVQSNKFEQLQLTPRVKRQSSLSSEDDESKTPQERRQWNKRVALPAAAIIITGSVIAMTQYILQYNLSGIATIVTGNQRVFTLLDLLKATQWSIYGSGLLTVVIAPIIYSIGYPKSHVLGAWCATDALLLACVGGLLQLSQFVKFVMGPALSSVYQAEAELRTPLLGLFFSMLVQWLLVGSEVFRVDPASLVGRVLRCGRRHEKNSTIESSSLVQSPYASYTSEDVPTSQKIVE